MLPKMLQGNKSRTNSKKPVPPTIKPTSESRTRKLSQKPVDKPRVPISRWQPQKKQTIITIDQDLGPNIEKLTDMYLKVLLSKNKTERELRQSLKDLRYLILKHGIPSTVTKYGSLRACVWKLLLGVSNLDSGEYINLVNLGPSQVGEKISNDVFRTLATCNEFTTKVSNDMLARILNAFCWKSDKRPKSRFVNLKFGYVQGMNVLLAPIAFVMPELDAFGSFDRFINDVCPVYVQPALEGVHVAVKLLSRVLGHVDNQLQNFLVSNGCDLQVFAFSCNFVFDRVHDVLWVFAAV